MEHLTAFCSHLGFHFILIKSNIEQTRVQQIFIKQSKKKYLKILYRMFYFEIIYRQF